MLVIVEPVVRLNVPVVAVVVIAIAEPSNMVPVLPLLIIKDAGAVEAASSNIIVLLPNPVIEITPLD